MTEGRGLLSRWGSGLENSRIKITQRGRGERRGVPEYTRERKRATREFHSWRRTRRATRRGGGAASRRLPGTGLRRPPTVSPAIHDIREWKRVCVRRTRVLCFTGLCTFGSREMYGRRFRFRETSFSRIRRCRFLFAGLW